MISPWLRILLLLAELWPSLRELGLLLTSLCGILEQVTVLFSPNDGFTSMRRFSLSPFSIINLNWIGSFLPLWKRKHWERENIQGKEINQLCQYDGS